MPHPKAVPRLILLQHYCTDRFLHVAACDTLSILGNFP